MAILGWFDMEWPLSEVLKILLLLFGVSWEISDVFIVV